MTKTATTLFFVVIMLFSSLFSPVLYQSSGMQEGTATMFYRNVSVYAPAVARTSNGFIGVVATITVAVENGTGCSGRVFVETMPFTQIDMQGSARLAVTVAGALTGIDVSNYDFFFVIQTSAPVIGGPSAGAVMTVATIAALEGWKLDNRTMMTGMIDPDGSVGPVGGIPEKIDAANSVGAKRFLIPKGQEHMYQTVTETKNVGGIIQIISKRVPVNVSKYAMDKYGIDVVEVEDINDALFYFTGHTFKTTVSNGSISTENYTESMEPLATHLLNEANQSYTYAEDIFNSSKESIPNSFFFNYRDQVKSMLKDSRDSLDRARETFNKRLFYSSTSNAFQSLIDSRFVRYASEYFTSNDRESYIENILEKEGSFISNRTAKAKNATISGIVSLQCVGAAQKRAFDAEHSLNDARKSYQKRDYLNALYKLAFAVERSKSVVWWLNISSTFKETGKVNNSILREVANRYIDLAIQSNTYSNIILEEMGASTSLLSGVDDLISDAQNQIDEYPASSLFASLEALSKSNLALEMVDGITKDKVERVRESAASAIIDSRNIGIEPLLAISYFEFAESLENSSSVDAVVYYRYSQMIAGALQFMINPPKEKQSIFVGIPPINPSSHYVSFTINSVWFYVSLGVSIILLIFGIIVIVRERRYKKEFPLDTWVPRSMQEYYRKH